MRPPTGMKSRLIRKNAHVGLGIFIGPQMLVSATGEGLLAWPGGPRAGLSFFMAGMELDLERVWGRNRPWRFVDALCPFVLGLEPLIAIGLAVLAGCSQSETMIGTSGPLTAFRAQAFLGWEIKMNNDSNVRYPGLYAINGLRHVPAHGTVKAATY